MQSPFNDKLAYSYPCKTSETCIDYEDYDPCESNEDIPEKDLAVLLKEEATKLAKENAQKAESQNDKKAKLTSDADVKQKHTNDGSLKEEDESGVNKKSCKYIKNPFFTNRLKLSTSHLPLPSPGPPPQNFPLATEESTSKICPKNKKKCRKEDKNKMPTNDEDGIYESDGGVTEEEEEGRKEEEEGMKKEEEGIKREEGIRKEEEARKEEEEGRKKEGEGKKKEEERRKEEGEPKNLYEVRDSSSKTKLKNYKKVTDQLPVCKKKYSEVSISFQPRKIPFVQKDLPQTSLKNLPELEHQILMACGRNEKEDCKKKCKKKDKVK